MELAGHALFGYVHAGAHMLLRGQHYPYTSDLRRINSRVAPTPSTEVAQWLQRINTPLVVQEWAKALQDHPDHDYTQYLLAGLQEGFAIGFDYQRQAVKSASSNMQSATKNKGVVDEYLRKEVELGRVDTGWTLESRGVASDSH